MDAPVEVPKFALPPPEEFFANTQKLLSIFGLSSVFYSPPTFKNLCDMLVKSSTNYGGDREAHLQVFDQLIHTFSRAPQTKAVIQGTASGQPEAVEQALYILLGALFHRAYRIINPEPASWQAAGNFFKAYVAPKAMKIQKLSRLESEVIYPALNIKLLSEIDALSVVNWCKALYNYMKKDNNYLKFPPYKQEPDFFGYLDKIIKAHQVQADVLTRQIDQFKFLQALSKPLKIIWESLLELLPLLSAEFLDKDKPLEIKALESILHTKKVPIPLQKRFLYLVKSDYVEKHMTCWEDFESYFPIWLDMQCIYTLYGAYYVLYEKAPFAGFSTDFQTVLLQGLNFTSTAQMIPAHSIDAIKTLFEFYLNFITDEKEVDWKLYNSNGTLRAFAKDCQAVFRSLTDFNSSATAKPTVEATPAGLFF